MMREEVKRSKERQEDCSDLICCSFCDGAIKVTQTELNDFEIERRKC